MGGGVGKGEANVPGMCVCVRREQDRAVACKNYNCITGECPVLLPTRPSGFYARVDGKDR